VSKICWTALCLHQDLIAAPLLKSTAVEVKLPTSALSNRTSVSACLMHTYYLLRDYICEWIGVCFVEHRSLTSGRVNATIVLLGKVQSDTRFGAGRVGSGKSRKTLRNQAGCMREAGASENDTDGKSIGTRGPRRDGKSFYSFLMGSRSDPVRKQNNPFPSAGSCNASQHDTDGRLAGKARLSP